MEDAVYYVNAQKSVGVGQTYADITESGKNSPSISDAVSGVGVTNTFTLHNTYADAIFGGVGVNTINVSPTTNASTGVVTFRQLDVNFAETNATIVQSSTQQSGGQIYFDGVDVPTRSWKWSKYIRRCL